MTLHSATETNQQLFRVLLTALSHPGQLCPVDITGIHDATAGLLLAAAQCLMDHEVAFAVAGSARSDLAGQISRSTGAAQVAPEVADFLVVTDASSKGLAARARRGTHDYPDTGATIIYQLSPLLNDHADAGPSSPAVALSGPGIRTTRAPEMPGLDTRELILLGQINDEYPLGVDAFFLSGNRALMGLPRSTRIEVN